MTIVYLGCCRRLVNPCRVSVITCFLVRFYSFFLRVPSRNILEYWQRLHWFFRRKLHASIPTCHFASSPVSELKTFWASLKIISMLCSFVLGVKVIVRLPKTISILSAWRITSVERTLAPTPSFQLLKDRARLHPLQVRQNFFDIRSVPALGSPISMKGLPA